MYEIIVYLFAGRHFFSTETKLPYNHIDYYRLETHATASKWNPSSNILYMIKSQTATAWEEDDGLPGLRLIVIEYSGL